MVEATAISQAPTPKPSSAEVQKYLDSSLRKLEEDPSSLEPFERRLLGKIKKAAQAVQEATKGAQDLKSQISQAETRMRSLELQAESHQGSVNAYIDEVVSMKFGIEESVTAPSKLPEVSDVEGRNKKFKAVKGEKD